MNGFINYHTICGTLRKRSRCCDHNRSFDRGGSVKHLLTYQSLVSYIYEFTDWEQVNKIQPTLLRAYGYLPSAIETSHLQEPL